MEGKKRQLNIIILVIIACIIMASIDLLSPHYFVKSGIKLILFLLIPISYSHFNKDINYRKLFYIKKEQLIPTILLGISVYSTILLAYLLFNPYFDFSNITETLQNNIGVNKANFVFVALYISFINSFLEEFFFRGFAYSTFKDIGNKKFAMYFSALMFSLYHIAIMTSWFEPLLYILIIISLFVAGLIFNWINKKGGNIYTSWIVHMCANFAINTIGFILFGII